MNNTTKIASIIALIGGLGGCASSADTGTLVGAGVGAVAGSAITGGHPVGIIGGAAAGGIIGHEIGENRDERRGYR